MIGGIYARRSKHDKKNRDVSPENQVMRCKAYALKLARELGETIEIDPAHIWIDKGASGKDFDRPEYLRAWQAIDRREIDVLLVYDIARLGRTDDVTDMFIERRHCLQCGVRVWAINEDLEITAIDDDSTDIRFLLGSRQAAKQRKDTIRLCREGKAMAHKLTPNKIAFGGRPSLGYKVEKGALIPDADRLPIVTQLFELAAQGMTAEDIALTFNRQGVTAPGGKVWYTNTVLRILANPIYDGQGVETNYIDIDSGEIVTTIIPAPGLIDPEIFTAAQRQTAMRRRSHTAPRGVYWLSCLLKCGICGRWLVGSKHGPGKPDTYRCVTRATHKRFDCPTCGMPIIPAPLIEEPVWADMRTVLSNPAILAEALKDGPDETQITDRLTQIAREVSNLKRQQTRLALDWTKEGITSDARREADAVLKGEIEQLESEGYGLEMRRLAMQRREPETVNLDNLPAKARAELAQQMVQRIDLAQVGPKAVTATVFYYLLPGELMNETFKICQRIPLELVVSTPSILIEL
jgi:site-specific DNA recombinase